MNFRTCEVYLQRKTWRRLWWVAKAKGIVTDHLADELLNEALEAKYPQLLPAEASLKNAEQEFIKSFGPEVQIDAALD
jgi:hypothetical protein